MPIHSSIKMQSEKDIPNLALGVRRGIKQISARAVEVMIKATGYLKERTPVRSSLMQRTGGARDLTIFGEGCFRFKLGWLRRDFPTRKFYPWFVLKGTGLYGGSPHYIYPVTKKVLVWENEEGETIIARRIRGQHSQQQFILDDAVKETQKYILKYMKDCILREFHEVKW